MGRHSRQYVNQIYLDVLGRPADTNGLEFWVSLIQQGDSTREVIRGIQHSPESMSYTVDVNYQTILGRAASPANVNYGLTGPRAALLTLQANLYGSRAYYTNAGGTTSTFIDALAQDVLGTSPTADQIGALTAAIDGGASRVGVAYSLLNTQQARQNRVQNLYQSILDRSADTTGLNFYVALLNQGQTPSQIELDLLDSSELYSNFPES